MPWQEWIDGSFIRYVVRHTSGTVVAVALSAFSAWVIKLFPMEDLTRIRIEKIEDVVVVGLFVFLAIRIALVLIKEVWKEARSGWNSTQVLAL